MLCEQARATLAAKRYDAHGPRAGELSSHLAGCPDCRAFAAAQTRLDELLAVDTGEEPRPGFDTRFMARLAEKRRAPRRSRLFAGALFAAAAAAVLMVTLRTVPAEDDLDTDLALAMDLELIENLEVVQHLDEIEAYEVLAQLNVAELDAALAGGEKAVAQ